MVTTFNDAPTFDIQNFSAHLVSGSKNRYICPACKGTPRQTPQKNSGCLIEWTVGSGVSEHIANLNVEWLTAEEASERLGFKVDQPGWWCRGVNWRTGGKMGNRYGQFKPQNPIALDPQKKPAKYLTAAGMEPDGIFLAMPEKDYWLEVYADKSIPVIIGEGAKKAGALLSLGYCAIAITGVWNWGKDGELSPILKRFLEGRKVVYIAFDSDYAEKDSCRIAVLKLAEALSQIGVKPKILVWPSQWKGVDDFIVANGEEAFKEVVANAQTVKNWERQFSKTQSTDDKKRKDKPPSARVMALEIAEKYQPLWAYHHEQQTWRVFNKKVWEKEPEKCFLQLVYNELKLRGIEWDSPAYVKNVAEVLSWELLVREWQTFDPKRYISFNNSILDMETGEALEHFPGSRFTSHLPYDYKPILGIRNPLEALKQHCPHVYKYMMGAMEDDPKRVFKLLAVINGILKWRFWDLQQFIHLVGKPGTGKGTFARLLQKIVGRENYRSSKLAKLGDGSTVASVIDKQLVLFPDERTQLGCEHILSFTGGDSIGYREIYKPAADAFFYGCIAVISNNPIFAGDTTGIERRLCLLLFNKKIPSHLRNPKLEKLMEEEIPGLVSVALSLGDLEVTAAIKGIGEAIIPAFKAHEWEMKTHTNTVAAWLNEKVVYDPGHESRTGDLYKNYQEWCQSPLKPVSHIKFPKELEEICQDYHNWDVYREERRNVSYMKNLRMRNDGDWETPTLLAQLVTVCDHLEPSCDHSCNHLESKQDKACDHLIPFEPPPKDFCKNAENLQSAEVDSEERNDETVPNGNTESKSAQSNDSKWSQSSEPNGNNESQTVTSANDDQIAVGDIVVLTSGHQWDKYEVVDIYRDETDITVVKGKLKSLANPARVITSTVEHRGRRYLRRVD